MGKWTSSLKILGLSPTALVALVCAGIAGAIILWYLLRRPKLTGGVKLVMALGIGVFPIGTAAIGSIHGFEVTTERSFCGGCHVMQPWIQDSENPNSTTLAAMHARNPTFGDKNCYTCHADYGMFGTVVTKANGMKHVWEYIKGFRKMTIEEAVPKIHIYSPFPNATCMRCHSTTLPGWVEEPEHAGMMEKLRAGEVSCASEGCHGPVHPFSKPAATGVGVTP